MSVSNYATHTSAHLTGDDAYSIEVAHRIAAYLIASEDQPSIGEVIHVRRADEIDLHDGVLLNVFIEALRLPEQRAQLISEAVLFVGNRSKHKLRLFFNAPDDKEPEHDLEFEFRMQCWVCE